MQDLTDRGAASSNPLQELEGTGSTMQQKLL